MKKKSLTAPMLGQLNPWQGQKSYIFLPFIAVNFDWNEKSLLKSQVNPKDALVDVLLLRLTLPFHLWKTVWAKWKTNQFISQWPDIRFVLRTCSQHTWARAHVPGSVWGQFQQVVVWARCDLSWQHWHLLVALSLEQSLASPGRPAPGAPQRARCHLRPILRGEPCRLHALWKVSGQRAKKQTT